MRLLYLSKYLKEVRKRVLKISEGKTFQVERTANAEFQSQSIPNRPQAPTWNLVERKRGQENTGNEAREETRSQVVSGKWSCEFRSVE